MKKMRWPFENKTVVMNKLFPQRIAHMGLSAAFALISALGTVSVAFGQEDDVFETRRLETQVKRQYFLSPSETKLLHPLIVSQNNHLVLAFFRYSQDQGTDFMSLWEEIRASRSDFETSLPTMLTSRPKQALRAARYEIESRVLELWADEYVTFLADQLELDRIQQALVSKILRKETAERHWMVIYEAQTGVRRDVDWQALTRNRDKSLREIFNSEQIFNYIQLAQRVKDLIG